MSFVKNILLMKIQVSEKNSTILIVFQMIGLKWIKSLTNFYWVETNSCQNLHFEQPGFAYSTCEPFTKHRERIQTFREKGNLKHLYRNELDKACFAHDTVYSDSKDLAKRIVSDRILKT